MKQELLLTTKIWKSGKRYVAYNPELEVASQGKTKAQAELRLKEAMTLFLETAKKTGTLPEVLRDAGFVLKNKRVQWPNVSFATLEVSV
ncbi:MAG: type II toxin-antitoxin system HicB family antitoxin [Candidatus Jorgensenbacteria bacterium]